MNNLLFSFMNDVFVPYLLPVIGTLLSALLAWGSAELIKLISSKVKNKELAAFLSTITVVATNAVKATYETAVKGIKGTDEWTEEAQKKVLNDTIETIKAELTTEALAYIEKQHGDINSYLNTLIHSILYDLKNGSKTTKDTNVTIETAEK